MNQNKLNTVTDAEWEVMRVVWTKEKTTSREVQLVLKEKKDWKATTVKTLLSRLVEKQLLATEKLGNKYLYYPLVAERQSVETVAEELLEKVCSRKVGTVVATVLADNLLSFEDIDQLETLLKEKRQTAVQEVPCNCTPGQCRCRLNKE